MAYAEAFFRVKSEAQVAEFFMIFPMASLCIYLMKPWSYPVFLAASSWAVFRNIATWQENYQGDQKATMAFLAFTGGMLMLMGYYLIPKVRRAFYDRDSQWWERKRRYFIETAALLTERGERTQIRVKNVSESGALVETKNPLAKGDKVALSLSLFDQELPIEALVIRKDSQVKNQYGLKFKLSPDMKRQLFMATQQLESKGVSHNQTYGQSFNEWLKDIPKGRGLVPEFTKYNDPNTSNKEGPAV